MGTQVNINLNAETFEANRKTDRQLYIQLIGSTGNNGWIAASATGTVSSGVLWGWHNSMVNAAAYIRGNLANVFNINDMNKYAREEYSNPSLDYFDLYENQWLPTLDAAVDWISINGSINSDPPVDIDTTDLTPLLDAIRVASE